MASSNVQLVAMKVITRLCRVIEKTCTSPTSTLEQHLMWDDIAILGRYLLMLSFNNCLDVANHLPYLFHIVTLLVHIGPISLRASIHGLVINIIHSLCTCTKPSFSGETQRLLRLSLDEFSLPKFYLLFGISDVKSAAVTAFRTHSNSNYNRHFCSDRHYNNINNLAPDRSITTINDQHQGKLSHNSLETITDALLEIMEACMKNIPDCDWLQRWTEMAKSFAFRYNPALQPRSIIVFGCISKSISDNEIIQLLRILVKALESFQDLQLIDSIILCLTRLQPLLNSESPIHRALFWIAISVLQLDEISLYASGLALLEQNLHTLDSFGSFEANTLKNVMIATREPLEWHFKQLDHSVGLSFKSNFHCALVGHLIKGFRHPTPTTVSRTTRILNMLLEIVAKPHKRDKFEVNLESVPYLAALIPVSEEVQSRVHLRHRVSRMILDRTSSKTFHNDIQSQQASNCTSTKNCSHTTAINIQTHSPTPLPSPSTLMNLPLSSYITQSHKVTFSQTHQFYTNSLISSQPNTPTSCRQKSLDSNCNFYIQTQASKITKPTLKPHLSNQLSNIYSPVVSGNTEDDKHWKSLDIESASNNYRPLFRTQRSSSMPTPKSHKNGDNFLNANDSDNKEDQQNKPKPTNIPTDEKTSPQSSTIPSSQVKQEPNKQQTKKSRLSVSNENNILLDPDVLTDFQNQALILTILVCVCYLNL